MKPIHKCTVCGRYIEEKNHCGQPATLVVDGAVRERLFAYLGT